MGIASRRMVHASVTTTPTLAWVQQQVREAARPTHPQGPSPLYRAPRIHNGDTFSRTTG
jgi:hypothetical protein